jgi:hypothetical protein
MNTQPTPRTDEVASRDGNWDTKAFGMTDYARQLERELAAKTAEFDRLNESLPKNKRLFTNALADKIIESQLKRIKLLEDELILAKKENP